MVTVACFLDSYGIGGTPHVSFIVMIVPIRDRMPNLSLEKSASLYIVMRGVYIAISGLLHPYLDNIIFRGSSSPLKKHRYMKDISVPFLWKFICLRKELLRETDVRSRRVSNVTKVTDHSSVYSWLDCGWDIIVFWRRKSMVFGIRCMCRCVFVQIHFRD